MGKEFNSSNNIQSVQLFRGIAAFMVVMGHSMSSGYFPREHILSQICWNGWMGVNIFFIISGFILPYAMYQKDYRLSDFGTFFIKRLIRIEPPYIISIVMVLLLNYSNTLTPWYTGPAFKVDWSNVLGHLGYLNAFTHAPWLNWSYWTLAIEFQYYFIIALCFPLLVHRNKAVMMITFFVLLAGFFVHIPGKYGIPGVFASEQPFFFMGIPNNEHIDSVSQIFIYLPFFLLGIAYFLFRVRKVTAIEFFLMAIACTFLFFFRHGLLMSAICVTSLICIHYIKRVPKAFLLLGTISYSLYLTHYVLVARFLALFQRFISKDYVVVGWVLSIIGCLVAAYFYWWLFERPFVNIAKRTGYKHRDKTRKAPAILGQNEGRIVPE